MTAKINRLILSILLCQLIGNLGTFATINAIPAWYATLNRPPLSPPNWVFGPVWGTLFTLMGIALFLIWDNGIDKPANKKAIWIFVAQIVLNALWTFIFFACKIPWMAFIEIVFLWIFIVWTIKAFYKVSKPAGWLLIPYILWVSFAAYLNLAFAILN